MKQEKRTSYQAGITRRPSDFLCGDGELAECINMTTDAEELKPVVQPVIKYDSGSGANVVKYIHKFNSEKRFIYVYASGGNYRVLWFKDADGSLITAAEIIVCTSEPIITSVGKTLIITDNNGIHYFLWKENAYVDRGQLPQPEFKFWMKKGTPLQHYTLDSKDYLKIYEDRWVQNTGDSSEILYESSHDKPYVDLRKQEEYNDLVIGLYSKNKKSIAEKKMFCEPFFVRTAIELVDGSYTHISQPIMMFPCVHDNTIGLYNVDRNSMTLATEYAELCFKQTKDLSDWNDIVKDVVVFVSAGVSPYNLSTDQQPEGDDRKLAAGLRFDGVYLKSGLSKYELTSASVSDRRCFALIYKDSVNSTTIGECWSVLVLNKKSDTDIINDLKASSTFYRLCGIGLEKIESEKSITEYMESGVLSSLMNQTILEYDDYYSNCKIYPKFTYSYNSRLNLGNVARGFFGGFDFFMPWDNDYANSYTIYVTIKTDEGKKVVSRRVENTYQKMGIYFYYPDARATNVVMYRDDGWKLLDAKLTEHPGLNGAYYFAGLPGSSEPGRATDGGGETSGSATPEVLGNYIIQSEVNNPWVFKAEGYHKVGTGKIIGMSTTTQALSQSQFGPFPLLVFSESGIWAMSVDKTGLYADIQPKSREICLNPNSITQTDDAVFFVSKKGLMVAERAGNGLGVSISCVSTQMDGRTFNTASMPGLDSSGIQNGNVAPWRSMIQACQGNESFLSYIRDLSTFLAYDYTDSRVLIINPSRNFAYMFSMKDGSISKTVLPTAMQNPVNDYPDTLLQAKNGKIYSFYDKPREEEIGSRQTGFLLTRPMKMEGPDVVVSLQELKHVGYWDTASNVKTDIWVSDDLINWHLSKSRFGAAAKYYRLGLYVSMLPTERLSGTIVREQPRRTDNLR